MKSSPTSSTMPSTDSQDKLYAYITSCSRYTLNDVIYIYKVIFKEMSARVDGGDRKSVV